MTEAPQEAKAAQVEIRTEYSWTDSTPAHNHGVLLPALTKILERAEGRTLIDLGCGNGSLTAKIADLGYSRAVGVDSAKTGIQHAEQNSSVAIQFVPHDLSDPLPSELHHQFDVALAAEVVEHLFLPRELFRRANEALVPGGILILTTPYHGWLKNVALAMTNRMDEHWSPGWDYGHIKFFSRATLNRLAHEFGYHEESFHRVGRIPLLAMSMISVFTRGSNASSESGRQLR